MAANSRSGGVQFKYIVIGDTEVGKSTLLLMLCEGEFIEHHETTIGVEFGSKSVTIEDTDVTLEIWDTVRIFSGRMGNCTDSNHQTGRPARRATSLSQGRTTVTPTLACLCTILHGEESTNLCMPHPSNHPSLRTPNNPVPSPRVDENHSSTWSDGWKKREKTPTTQTWS